MSLKLHANVTKSRGQYLQLKIKPNNNEIFTHQDAKYILKPYTTKTFMKIIKQRKL